MHIYFVGIGGTGVGPLALIAAQAGYTVSGSDRLESEYTKYLKKKGLDVYIDQSGSSMAMVHDQTPIDWVVSVSSITRNTPDHPELVFAREHDIQITERDAFLNEIITRKNLKMIAAAGTHGKTTTTAMIIWTMLELGIPISYSVGAKTNFSEMGHFEPDSEYFVYECDEFHRNFLHYNPSISLITGITWDHHEVFPTRDDYKSAFVQFINQSSLTYIWDTDANYLGHELTNTNIQNGNNPEIDSIKLAGLYNRRNAWLVACAVSELTKSPIEKVIDILNHFPGTQRRMEEITTNLYTDYAHTPEKIVGAISVARDKMKPDQKLIIVYEPLTNRRQHYMKELYKTTFLDADKVYWIPSYLARENPEQPILKPEELITYLQNPEIAEPAEMNDDLWQTIQHHLLQGDYVLCLSGGGGGSLDEWLRKQLES